LPKTSNLVLFFAVRGAFIRERPLFLFLVES